MALLPDLASSRQSANGVIAKIPSPKPSPPQSNSFVKKNILVNNQKSNGKNIWLYDNNFIYLIKKLIELNLFNIFIIF